MFDWDVLTFSYITFASANKKNSLTLRTVSDTNVKTELYAFWQNCHNDRSPVANNLNIMDTIRNH